MVKNRINIKTISAVAFSRTVVIDLPCGPRYHGITLFHGYSGGASNTVATALANITGIRVKVNGRPQRTYALGSDLRDLNLLNGTAYDCQGTANTGQGVSIPLFFAEPWRQDEKDQDALAWFTAGWQSFQIEVDLGAGGAGPQTAPTITAIAVVDELQPAQGTNPGICKHILQSFNSSGQIYDIVTLDRRDWLQQISIYPDSGGSNQPSKVTVKHNGVIRHELGYVANFALLTNSAMTPTATGRTQSPGIYDVVLDHDGLLGSAVPLDGSRDLAVTVEAASAMSGTQKVYVQRVGPIE